MKSEKTTGSTRSQAFRGGTYSILITVIVLGILIVANVFVSVLPTSYTWFDISSSKLYSVTANTKAVVNNLEKDVQIYWIVQAGEEDEIIENLLARYDSLSDHIEIVKKNPDVYPTFAEQYTDETVQNNSLVVECGTRARYIGYDDIYVTEANIYSYSYNSSFDGEGAITSAIDYVVNEDQPTMYLLMGHGEEELPETFMDQLTKENIDTAEISLLAEDEIPEDAAAIMIFAPASDISEDEKDELISFVKDGGKLLVAAGPVDEEDFENLLGILGNYGIEAAEGIVVEADRGHYLLSMPYFLIPNMESDAITDALIEDHYLVNMPIAMGLSVTGSSGSSTVTELLSTTDSAFSKISGYGMDNFELEDGDIEGPFTLGVRIETTKGGQIIWFASSRFLEDIYNAYSSGANVDLAVNAVSSLVGESEAMAIRSKSLNYNYLTISASTSSLLKVLLIGVFPLLYLGIGIVVVLKRRSKLSS